MYLLRVPIRLLDCLCLFWLSSVRAVVLVLRHSIKNCYIYSVNFSQYTARNRIFGYVLKYHLSILIFIVQSFFVFSTMAGDLAKWLCTYQPF